MTTAHPPVVFAPSEWTRVEDGLPEPLGDVYYVQLESGDVQEGYWLGLTDDDDNATGEYGWFTPNGGKVVAYAPYHLPEPPRWE